MSEIVKQLSSTIDGLTREFDVIAHNLANVSTVGFKRRCNEFSKSLAAQMGHGGECDKATIDITSTFDFSQGSMVETGRKLDVALYGKGFLVVETPDGPLYTRNGMFRLNQNNQIVDSQGRPLAGMNGPISIPADASDSQINISGDGNVTVNGFSAGKLKLVDFKEDESKLVAAGDSCYVADKDIKPVAADKLMVKQGYQEGSNVAMVEELVDMIMVTRLYEANMKFMSVGKDNSKSLLNVAMG